METRLSWYLNTLGGNVTMDGKSFDDDAHGQGRDTKGHKPVRGREINLHEVSISAAGVELIGDLCVDPHDHNQAVIVFAHGSGSSRQSPRNKLVANVLYEHGFATLLVDLLTPAEQFIVSKRFDISLLTTRLSEVVYWIRQDPRLRSRSIGLFGASTGAAAALRVAAIMMPHINCVVCRGGRTDLTGSLVRRVRAPTLLIVGGEDKDVLEINHTTMQELVCPKRLAVVPGATHLFEEQGALDDVAHIVSYWFKNHMDTRCGRAAPHA
jgi:pimeloyl-ACP methyl ester carboxylesterase